MTWPPRAAYRRTLESAWDSGLGMLLDFKLEHGHTEVPYNSGELIPLKNWLTGQKSRVRQGTMPHSRLIKLQHVMALRVAA